MTTDRGEGIEGETLIEFLARPEVTSEVYAALRALHRGGRTAEEASQRIWNLARGFRPMVHVGRIRDQITNAREFPPDTWAEVKAALLHLEAGLAEFQTHAAKRLILRPRRERLGAAMRAVPTPPTALRVRVEAALAAATA